jgi:hypothetical protein
VGPLTYVIAILGCGDGAVACEPVTTLEPRYASRAACVADTGSALLAHSRFDYPELVAECRATPATRTGERTPGEREEG